MTLAEFRADQGMTIEQCAVALGLAPSSQSWLSEIEAGKRDASIRLALKIEAWSGGKVSAASVNREIAGLRPEPAQEAIAS